MAATTISVPRTPTTTPAIGNDEDELWDVAVEEVVTISTDPPVRDIFDK